jgi:hypothetical protein
MAFTDDINGGEVRTRYNSANIDGDTKCVRNRANTNCIACTMAYIYQYRRLVALHVMNERIEWLREYLNETHNE